MPEAKRAWQATGEFIKTIFVATDQPAETQAVACTRRPTPKTGFGSTTPRRSSLPFRRRRRPTPSGSRSPSRSRSIRPASRKRSIAVLERYPLFKVRLKNGFFWKYPRLQRSALHGFHKPPHNACGSLLPKEHNGYMFQIYYRGPLFVVLEMFHSLADGSGAIMFVKSILYVYLTSIGKKITPDNLILTLDSKPTKAEYEDRARRPTTIRRTTPT
ncbi:MAG: hypothetical protein M0C28_18725 [Candidatus Moduliflexus flocculans]|nr:hypothetical protein [Candidatus Moduliflexus flocculans]